MYAWHIASSIYLSEDNLDPLYLLDIEIDAAVNLGVQTPLWDTVFVFSGCIHSGGVARMYAFSVIMSI